MGVIIECQAPKIIEPKIRLSEKDDEFKMDQPNDGTERSAKNEEASEEYSFSKWQRLTPATYTEPLHILTLRPFHNSPFFVSLRWKFPGIKKSIIDLIE